MKTIIDDMTLNTYIDICRGLFEDHKLIFSMLIGSNVLRFEKRVPTTSWQLLLAIKSWVLKFKVKILAFSL